MLILSWGYIILFRLHSWYQILSDHRIIISWVILVQMHMNHLWGQYCASEMYRIFLFMLILKDIQFISLAFDESKKVLMYKIKNHLFLSKPNHLFWYPSFILQFSFHPKIHKVKYFMGNMHQLILKLFHSVTILYKSHFTIVEYK